MVVRKLVGKPMLFASLSLLLLLMSQAGPVAPLATNVCGPISSDTNWTVALSPYVATCDVTVNAGVTLTVEPGVVVKFQHNTDDLIVNGRLLAQGTEALPIVFTSYQDDAHGGDTNGDGSATSPAAGDWSTLAFDASSSGSVLDWAWIGYGGNSSYPYYYYGSVQLYTSDVTVQRTVIASSWNIGLYVGQVNSSHPLVLTGNTFLDNAGWGWAVYDKATGTLTDITLVGNTSSGSLRNGFGVRGSIVGTVTYSSTLGFPFIVEEDLAVQAGSSLTIAPGTVVKFQDAGDAIIVNGQLTAQGTASETIVFTSLRDDAHGGDTNGDGFTTSPAAGDWSGIVFEASSSGSVLEQAWIGYSGDPQPYYSNWASVNFYSSEASIQDSVIQSSSTRGITVDNAAVHMQGNQISDNLVGLCIRNGATVGFDGGLIESSEDKAISVSGASRLLVSASRIERNPGSALVVDGDQAWVHVTGSSLTENGLVGNTAGGVRNNGKSTVVLSGDPGAGNAILANAGYGAYQAGAGGTILATYNWWGDASGPTHPSNPGGLGEEVSSGVVFDPWLTSSAGLPASAFVRAFAPLSFSAGEAVNLGIQFANVLTQTLNDAAVVVQLPEESDYSLSTGGGLYWPEEHEVVWKLGDVAPGESFDALVRVQTRWGLPENTQLGTKALAAARNLPNPGLDLTEVLSYTPVVTLSQHFLTPAEITATLDADPELDALFQEARAMGFTFYGTALSETFSSGGELLTLALLDRERMDQMVHVRRDGEQRTILHTTSTYVTEYNDTGGWRYDLETGNWSFWGDWAATRMAGGALAATRSDNPSVECDDPKSEYTCRRNCLIRYAGGVMDALQGWIGRAFVGFWHPCMMCRLFAQECDECSKEILKERAKARPILPKCYKRCEQDHHAMDCQDDYNACSRRPGYTPDWYVRRELCDLSTCDYAGFWRDYLPCNRGAKCVHGCCPGVSDGADASSICDEGEGSALFASSSQASGPTCECAAGLCSLKEMESLTAHDPNAKLGPAEAAAGEWISYTVQYENVGAGTAYGVYVEDRISPVVDASTLQIEDGGLYFPASRTIYWPIGELGAGAGGSVDFRVQVPADAVSGTVIANGAMVYFPSVPETTPTGDVVTLVQDVVAHSQRVETVEGVPLAITLTGSSPAGPLSYQIVEGPGGGTLGGTPPDVVYTPAPNFEGPDGFTFRVSDGLKESMPAEVSVVVQTGAETIPPEVIATSPSRDETGVQVSDTPVFSDTYTPYIYVYFSEPIEAATVTAASLFVTDSAGRHLNGYAFCDAAGTVARFVPQERLYGGKTYTATVTTGVHDTSGNALAADYVWSFTTEAGPPGGTIYLPLVLRQY